MPVDRELLDSDASTVNKDTGTMESMDVQVSSVSLRLSRFYLSVSVSLPLWLPYKSLFQNATARPISQWEPSVTSELDNVIVKKELQEPDATNASGATSESLLSDADVSPLSLCPSNKSFRLRRVCLPPYCRPQRSRCQCQCCQPINVQHLLRHLGRSPNQPE